MARAISFALVLALATLPLAEARETPEDGKSCSAAESEWWGFGGTETRCTLHCDRADSLAVDVYSEDPDAVVRGAVECGSGSAVCQGIGSCTSAGVALRSGTGTCKASSDEFWDSSLVVTCSSESPGCVSICVLPVLKVEIRSIAGVVTGLACRAEGCVPIPVECAVDRNGRGSCVA